MERPENVLQTSQINLPGMSLERQITTYPGSHFRTSQDVRLGRPWDLRLGFPRDGQIGSLGDVLGTSGGPIFAGWAVCFWCCCCWLWVGFSLMGCKLSVCVALCLCFYGFFLFFLGSCSFHYKCQIFDELVKAR